MLENEQFFRTKRGLIQVESQDGKPVSITFTDRNISIPAANVRRISSIDAGDECASVFGMKYLVLDYVDDNKEERVLRTMLSGEVFDEFSKAMIAVF